MKNQCRQEYADSDDDSSCDSELSFVNARPIVPLDTSIGGLPPVRRPVHADKLMHVFEVAEQGNRSSVIVLSRRKGAVSSLKAQQQWYSKNAKFASAAAKLVDCEVDGIPFVASYIELLSKIAMDTPGKLRSVTDHWLSSSAERLAGLAEESCELGLKMLLTPSTVAAPVMFGEYYLTPFALIEESWQTTEPDLLSSLTDVCAYVKSLYWLIGGLNLFEECDEQPSLLSKWSTSISPRSAEILLRVLDGRIVTFSDLSHELKKTTIPAPAENKTAGSKSGGLNRVIGKQDVKQVLSRVAAAAGSPSKTCSNLLFFGPSGCGKTFLAKCFAEEVGLPLIQVRPSDVVSMYVGECVLRLRRIFDEAIAGAPCLLFFDEMDFLVPDRSSLLKGMEHKSEEINEVLIGIESARENGVCVLGATNQPFSMDASVFSPGRFDRIIYVGPADEDERVELLHYFMQDWALATDLDLADFVSVLEGFSVADLRALAQRSQEISLSLGKCPISEGILNRALSTIKASISSQTEQRFAKFIDKGYRE